MPYHVLRGFMFNFADLVLESMTLEVRFEQGYLYWDTAGRIWRDISKAYPSAQLETIEPRIAKFRLEDEDIQISSTPYNTSFTVPYPKDLDTFGDIADKCINIIAKYLEINVFTRIGNRFIYVLKLEDTDSATELIRETGFFTAPNEKLSIFGNNISNAQVKFTAKRDDEIGYNVNIAHFSRKLEMTAPKSVEFDASKFIMGGLLIDIDYHTLKPYDAGNFCCDKLIKKNKKDMEYIIKGIWA
jgi:hypothetical protein